MKYLDGHQTSILALNVYEEKRWIRTTEIFSNRHQRSRFAFQSTLCCDEAVQTFNIDKQMSIKQLNVISISSDIEQIY